MPRIDNMMLVKSVQLLRRLGTEPKLRGVFCNLSLQSLRDPDFFPELVEFLEENSALGDSLTFRLSQPSIQDLGAIELASLRTLGKIGFGSPSTRSLTSISILPRSVTISSASSRSERIRFLTAWRRPRRRSPPPT